MATLLVVIIFKCSLIAVVVRAFGYSTRTSFHSGHVHGTGWGVLALCYYLALESWPSAEKIVSSIAGNNSAFSGGNSCYVSRDAVSLASGFSCAMDKA